MDRSRLGFSLAGHNPMFSVIVPTHNRAHLLPRAIQSVLNQTLADWELIVVDDGSTDDTQQVVARFDDPRIRYSFQDKAGAAQARNRGAQHSEAQTLVFLDSDDELLPECLEHFAAILEQPQVGIACGAALACVEKETDRTETLLLPWTHGALYHHQTALFLTGAFAVRRELFEAVGGYRPKASMQQKDLAIRVVPHCLQHGWRIESFSTPVLRWFRHGEGHITTDPVAQYEGALGMLDDYGEEMLARDPKRYGIYCSKAGVNALRLGRHKEARRFLWRAIRHYPWYWRFYARFLLSLFPPLGHAYWQDRHD